MELWTLSGSRISTSVVSLLFVGVLILCFCAPIEGMLREQHRVLPRWCYVSLLIAIMLAFVLRAVFPGQSVFAQR